jgi:UDP-GlcNAc3NAcA epimerase
MQKSKIATIIGARPQFIKAAAISRAIRNHFQDKIREVIVHTGQHYDENMSDVFFRELELPSPDYNLEAGSGSHAWQTGEIMRKAEEVLLKENPQLVIVYGDTNTTMAGALAASKLNIPVAHIEAGLRSGNKTMPEEINRVVCDHVSTFLFSPTKSGFDNLVNEGFNPNSKPPFHVNNPAIFHCGDVMFDNALYFLQKAEKESGILKKLDLEGKEFVLCTIHRQNNTDNSLRINTIMSILNELSKEKKIDFVFPVHPRTSKMINSLLEKKILNDLKDNQHIKLTSPLSYFDMLLLENHCRMVMTDSGGVQKEAFFFEKPCLVLRPESEWKELIEQDAASITDIDEKNIRKEFDRYYQNPSKNSPPIFGDGHAAEFILRELANFLEGGLQE